MNTNEKERQKKLRIWESLWKIKAIVFQVLLLLDDGMSFEHKSSTATENIKSLAF